MPDLFPSFGSFALSTLVIVGAQFIYATVGFGAGMFALALLVFVLPDLAGAVTVLLLITFVTEVWVLSRAWRRAEVRLLAALTPTMVLGLWLGAHLLVSGNSALLKRLLGFVVAGAGGWFLWGERQTGHAGETASPARLVRSGVWWAGLPVGLLSGCLTGLFGTGGPPVIVFLRGYRLDKSAFRATLLWFFLMCSLVRAPTYVRAGLLTLREVEAAVWLLPAAAIGTAAGMAAHRRLSEKHFGRAVSVLLVILGVLLLVGGGR